MNNQPLQQIVEELDKRLEQLRQERDEARQQLKEAHETAIQLSQRAHRLKDKDDSDAFMRTTQHKLEKIQQARDTLFMMIKEQEDPS
jgi:uncharacterized coiled-coil DUF342 family protein